MFHISYIYIALVARSFEIDKLVLDLFKALFVEYIVAKILKKEVEKVEEVGA